VIAQVAVLGLVLGALLVARWGCSSTPKSRAAAESTLELDGYTDVAVTGFSAWACGGDGWRTVEFAATSPAGEPVTGAVCCGAVLRACSIRTDVP
jgi:hypothetical protein